MVHHQGRICRACRPLRTTRGAPNLKNIPLGCFFDVSRHQGLRPFGVQKKHPVGCFFGTPSGTRTLDTLIKSQVLYQLS